MEMSINKKRPISQLEPFEKPCFVVVGLVDATPLQLQLILAIIIVKLVSLIEMGPSCLQIPIL
jgi:hypothetical protein